MATNIKKKKVSELPEATDTTGFWIFGSKTVGGAVTSVKFAFDKITSLFGVVSEFGQSITLAVSQKLFTEEVNKKATKTDDDGNLVVYSPDGKLDKVLNFASSETPGTSNTPLQAVKNNASGTLDYNTATNVNTIKSTGEYLCAYAVLDEGTTGEIAIVKYSTQWLVIGKDASGNSYMISLTNDIFKCIFKVLPNGTLSTRYNLASIPPIYTPSSKKRVVKNGNVLTVYSYEDSGWVAVSVLNVSDYGITQAAIGYVHYNNVAWGDNSQFSLIKKGANSSESWSIVPDSVPTATTSKKLLCLTDEYPYIGQTDEIAIDKVLDFSSTSDVLTPIHPIGNNAGAVTYDAAANRATLVSSGEYLGGYTELSDSEVCQMDIINAAFNWWVIGLDAVGNYYMANIYNPEKNTKVYKVTSTGVLSTNWTVQGFDYSKSSPKRYVKAGDSIALYSLESGKWSLLITLSAAAYGITRGAFGNTHYKHANWGANTVISLNKVTAGESESKDNWSINPNSIPLVASGKTLVATNSYPYIGQMESPLSVNMLSVNRKQAKLNLTGGKIILYGDSISSTDYTWYKSAMETLTGANVYNGGFSGYNISQLAKNAQLQRLFNYNPNLIVVLLGGNDTGAVGSVGTFGLIDGEPTVSETDVTTDYNGTYFIQGVSHIMRKVKSQYYNIRERANLTGSETEAQKEAKIDAVIKPYIVFCTTLPQKRNNDADTFSNPTNWRRKRDAIVECCNKYNVHCIDLYSLLDWDMSLEPFWISPTNKTNNKGIYTMDGIHPNKYGYNQMSSIICGEIGII
ncbi:SGNH/GDSL hydrolase family protein [Dysgonomonas sp.]